MAAVTGGGEEQLGNGPPGHGEHQLVLKFPVQRPGGVLRDQRQGCGPGKGERCQCAEHCRPVSVVVDDGILRPVVHRSGGDALNAPQIVFRKVCLLQCHPPTVQMDPQAAVGFMQNGTFHA